MVEVRSVLLRGPRPTGVAIMAAPTGTATDMPGRVMVVPSVWVMSSVAIYWAWAAVGTVWKPWRRISTATDSEWVRNSRLPASAGSDGWMKSVPRLMGWLVWKRATSA
jgi:hypothetical protein